MSESIRDGLRQVVREHTIRRATKIAPDEWPLWGCWGCEWEGDSSGHTEHVGDMVLAYLAAQATEAGVAEVLADRLGEHPQSRETVGFEADDITTVITLVDVPVEELAGFIAAALAPLLAARAETRTVGAEQVEAAARERFVLTSMQPREFAERIWDSHPSNHPVKAAERREVRDTLAALGIEVRDAD